MKTHREPFWGPGNPRRIRWLTPAEQKDVWKAEKMNEELPYFIGIAIIVIVGVSLLFH